MPLTGTVPEIDAVTDPICAVPATNAGSVVSDTGCVAGKLEMLAVTLPICAVPDPMVTVPEMAGSELIVRLFPTVTVPPTVTALARSWVLVRDASEKVTACEAGKLRTDMLPVTAPKVVDCDAGKLRTDTDPVTLGVPEIEIEPTHTLVPLTALVMSVIA